MMELTTLARPYALAAFKIAGASNEVASWSGVLTQIAAVVSDAAAIRIIRNPKNGRDKVSRFLIALLPHEPTAMQARFVDLLVQQHRIEAAPTIAVLFSQYAAAAEGAMDAEVCSAYPMTEEEQTTLSDALERRYGKKVRLSVTADRDLIGGAIIKAGNQVIDASLKGRLERLAESLSS